MVTIDNYGNQGPIVTGVFPRSAVHIYSTRLRQIIFVDTSEGFRMEWGGDGPILRSSRLGIDIYID